MRVIRKALSILCKKLGLDSVFLSFIALFSKKHYLQTTKPVSTVVEMLLHDLTITQATVTSRKIM